MNWLSVQNTGSMVAWRLPFIYLYDKGYHTASEFRTAHDLGVDTLVAVPSIGRASQAPDPRYNAEHFDYDKKNDTYTCPQGKLLTSNGSWYKGRNYYFKQYKTRLFKNCPVRQQSTTAKANGKIIQRSEFAQYIEANAKRIKESGDTYKKRQALVEHPFGTIKRQWGFDHIMTKKRIASASADFGLIALAYNLRRLLNLKIPFQCPENFFFGLSRLKEAIWKTISQLLGNLDHFWTKPDFSGQLALNRLKTLF